VSIELAINKFNVLAKGVYDKLGGGQAYSNPAMWHDWKNRTSGLKSGTGWSVYVNGVLIYSHNYSLSRKMTQLKAIPSRTRKGKNVLLAVYSSSRMGTQSRKEYSGRVERGGALGTNRGKNWFAIFSETLFQLMINCLKENKLI